MKKKFFVFNTARRITTALLTSIMIIAGSAQASANQTSGTEGKSAISYVGMSNGIMTFNISYENATGEEVLIELTDENGKTVYQRAFIGKTIDKNIYLKSAGAKCLVKFTIKSGKVVTSEKFEIEPTNRMVKETVVTKL